MDARIEKCPQLTERDVALLYRVEQGLHLTADVSRADVLLFCQWNAHQLLAACHAAPHSISSIYINDVTGRLYETKEHPLVLRALTTDRPGTQARQVLSSGAPVIQQVYPIHNAANRVIAALLFETNLIESERQRRRAKPFRTAVAWLHGMAVRGEIEIPEPISRFESLDGIYVVDEESSIRYMSGIATNLFRTIGLATDMRGQPVSALEPIDAELVDNAMQANRCVELRHESDDGRVWVRTVLPLRAPPSSWQRTRRTMERRLPWRQAAIAEKAPQVDGALVMVHNRTEAVQKERELNVKSAMIQEVHHRVKNNLQTIAAILRIQARRCDSDEARQHLGDAVNRILSMSVIHEYLSQDEHRPINIRDLCLRIISQAQQVAVNPSQQIAIDVAGPNIRLPAGQATATALVVNELLLNAIEHGLRGRPQGRVLIQLEDLGDWVRLLVEDDGLGLPDDFQPAQSRSLGLQIINTLVTDDLKGNLAFESAKTAANGAESTAQGTRVVVAFPKRSAMTEPSVS
ncbi:MAG: sensor histidine kinase [Caldilineaceae bacterium]|nr:sensor histidine kinase [Caldilineaceae bacterium]